MPWFEPAGIAKTVMKASAEAKAPPTPPRNLPAKVGVVPFMSRPHRGDKVRMGRILFFLLLVGTGWFLLNVIGISIDPRGVGTKIDGREVIRDAGQLEARFRVVGSLHETYMLFGGDAQQRRNSIIHVIAAGLPIRNARSIAAVHPDFYMCKSPGAKQAMRHTQTLGFIAANRAVLNTLIEAVDLFKERLETGGERTCISVTGAPITLESVRVVQDGTDVTRDVVPSFKETQLVLAQSAQLQDCRSLLR